MERHTRYQIVIFTALSLALLAGCKKTFISIPITRRVRNPAHQETKTGAHTRRHSQLR